LFGGTYDRGNIEHDYPDVWEWDGTEWCRLALTGPDQPDGRSAHSMAYDTDRHLIQIFGGAYLGHNFNGEFWQLPDDVDCDGLPDFWELQDYGVPVQGDPQHPLNLYNIVGERAAPGNIGARPDHKDIFVEVDSMAGLQPSAEAIAMLNQAFDQAPVHNP